MVETIFLTPKKTGIAAFREKKTILGRATKVLTSPKTTLALGATLATLLTAGAAAPAATSAALRAAPSVAARSVGKVAKGAVSLAKPKSIKGALGLAVGVPTAVGVLSSSAKARKIAKTALDPRESIKRGQKLGGIIEDPSKAEDILGIKEKTTLKEKVLGGLKTAGIYGGAAAAIAGGAALTKKALQKRKEEKALEAQLQPTALGAAQPRPVGLGGVPIVQAQPTQSSPQITSREAPQSTNGIKPIQNIIQIAVR